MPLVFMVAEKPMLAHSIAKILSNNDSRDRKGWNGACPVIEYEGSFRGKPAHFKMTSTCGHVMGMDFPVKYNNWETVDPARLFDVEVGKKEANPKLKMNDFLASEAKNADYVVLWLDCDKEGENICFEVIDAIRHVIRLAPDDSNIFRAKFSAISAKDINEAMRNLGRPNVNESLSVDARQELDLRIGCAFTRFQTKFFHSKYGDLDSSLVSFGPCQTPTLGFCVARYDQIQSFKPESYWVLQVSASHEKSDLKLEWSRGRLFDKDACHLFADRVKNAKEVLITDVSSEKRYKGRPAALNTVELMRIASSGLGMAPSHCMSIAEQLYTQGFISYPRTETTQYPQNFDARGLVKELESDAILGPLASLALSSGLHAARKGHDVGDHPPITPMKCDSTRRLSGDQFRLFEYIVQHFLATVSEDCCYLLTTARFRAADEEFSLSGRVVLVPGFTAILNWTSVDDNNDDTKLPADLKIGQKLKISDVKVVERETTAPDYLTESELISLMEQHGVGTDASIPVHINNICQRNYVTVSTSGRKLIPTRLGIVLVHGYWKIDSDLVQPKMRAAVETQLDLIAKGRSRYEAVTEHALKIFRMKFEYFVLNICHMDELFEVSFSSLADTGKPFTRCGICRRYMKLILAKPIRLHCSNCQQTYSLPQARDPILRPYSDQKCPLDEFDLVYFSSTPGTRGFSLCPYCFNNPPFDNMLKYQGCNECLHPGCKHAVGRLGIAQCPKCPTNVAVDPTQLKKCGVLVLEPTSGPKWKISCNKCPLIIPILQGAAKIKVLANKSCPDCESQLVTVEYKPGQSKLGCKEDNRTGCIFCDEEMKKHTNLKNLDKTDFGLGSGRSGAFRGRRGRGRGRGRGHGRGRSSNKARFD